MNLPSGLHIPRLYCEQDLLRDRSIIAFCHLPPRLRPFKVWSVRKNKKGRKFNSTLISEIHNIFGRHLACKSSLTVVISMEANHLFLRLFFGWNIRYAFGKDIAKNGPDGCNGHGEFFFSRDQL